MGFAVQQGKLRGSLRRRFIARRMVQAELRIINQEIEEMRRLGIAPTQAQQHPTAQSLRQ